MMTWEKGYHSVSSGARHHFIIGLVIDLDDKTVQINITKGHYFCCFGSTASACA